MVVILNKQKEPLFQNKAMDDNAPLNFFELAKECKVNKDMCDALLKDRLDESPGLEATTLNFHDDDSLLKIINNFMDHYLEGLTVIVSRKIF